MAEAKKKRVIKPAETVREKATKKTEAKPKTKRLHKVAHVAKKPLVKAKNVGQMEYHPIKMPDSRWGRFMTKSRRFTPKFFREAWAEVKLVTWPNRSETAKLTVAVFIFAIVLGGVVAIVDYGLDRVFKQLLLN